MILPTDIHTLDSFRRQSKDAIDRLHNTGRPEVLTVNGRPAIVVQDAAAYEMQMERLQVLEALAESDRQIENGQYHDAQNAVRALMKGGRAAGRVAEKK